MVKGWHGDRKKHSKAAKKGHRNRKKPVDSSSKYFIREAKNFTTGKRGYTVFHKSRPWRPIFVDLGQPNWFRTKRQAKMFMRKLK